ncbi:MAG: tRNA-intron lyase [Candidatus Aenigmatarchaeota archaeon]
MLMMKAQLAKDRVIVWDKKGAEALFDEGAFGKLVAERLELSLVEAAYLSEKERLEIIDDGKAIGTEAFIKYCNMVDSRFDCRYAVYKDLRERDLPARTGFKFGCDFRVYAKGVKPLKRGPKSAKEHTKWIVFAVPEGYVFSFPELSRAVRLAHNIRANMLWAVVGKQVRYYQVEFFKP